MAKWEDTEIGESEGLGEHAKMASKTGFGPVCANLLVRIGIFLVAAVPLGLLATALQLTPASDGLGTHQQLGLPPCSMRVILGIRCPACGMTTSWAHFTRGQWISSLESNVAGFLLAGLSVIFAPIAIGSAFSGRMPSWATQKYATVALVAIGIVATAEWLVRIFMP